MPLFVVVLLKKKKRTIYNKETKREAENERQENERSQSGHKKTLTADSAPDPNRIHTYFLEMSTAQRTRRRAGTA